MPDFLNLTMNNTQFTDDGSTSAEGDYIITVFFVAAMVLLVEKLLEAHFSSVSYKFLALIACVAFYVVKHVVIENNSKQFVPRKQPAEVLLTMIMPMMLLKITYSADVYLLKRCWFQIVVLSTVGMVLFSLMVAYVTLPFESPSNGIMWVHMVAYGMSFCGTDDVEISKSYLEYEAIQDALVILDGEFLLTSAFCIFGVTISSGIFDGVVSEWYQVMCLLIRYFGLGVVVGYPISWLIAIILPHMLDDIPNFVIGLIVYVYFIFYCCEYLIHCSGTIATFIACTFTVKIRKRISLETGALFKLVFDLLNSLFMYTQFLMCAYIQIYYMLSSITILKVVHCVATFFICFISRILVLAILYPVFKYTGNRLQINSMLALLWLSKKGLIQIITVHSMYVNPIVKQSVYTLGGKMIVSITLGIIFQTIFTKTFLKSLRLTNVACNKKYNLGRTIELINARNILLITTNKTFRLFSEIKWTKITEVTALINPYLSFVNVEKGSKKALRTFCEECQQEVLIKQVHRDFLEVAREAKLQVLKAYKVSVQRLFWKKLINEETAKYILKMVEDLIELKKLVFLEDNLVHNLRRRTLLDSFKELLVGIGKDEIVLKPPRKKFRRFCYKIIMLKYYELFIYALCLSFVIVYYVRSYDGAVTLYEYKTSMEFFYTIMFTFDFFVKIMAYSHITLSGGIRLYMSNKWNVLDFITLLGTIFVVLYNSLLVSRNSRTGRTFIYASIAILMRQITTLRILRTIVVFNQHRKWLVKICNVLLSRRKSFCYDVVTALLMCHDDIIHILSAMQLSPDIHDHLMELLEDERDRIREEIYHMQIALPTFTSTHHTEMVCNGTLTFMKTSAASLKIRGLLGYTEDEDLGIKYMTKKKLKIKVPQPLNDMDALQTVLWLQETKIFNTAVKTAGIVSWKENDIIFRVGQIISGVIIIREGVLMSYYESKTESLEQLQNYGILPIADCYDYKEFSSKVQKCLVPGSSIGLLGVLTGRKTDATVIAKVEGKGVFIPKMFFIENINQCTDPIKGFYSTLWKNVSFDIARSLLWESEYYRTKTQQELYNYLHRSLVPYLCDRRTFVLNECVKDIVLIEGLVKDIASKLIYSGPAYIPRGISCLALLREKDMTEPKLWIVPTRNAVISNILKYHDYDSSRINRF